MKSAERQQLKVITHILLLYCENKYLIFIHITKINN